MKQFVTALLVAAGNSTRMGGGKSKQLMLLHGMPVIAHTLRAFEKAPCIDAIVLVCRKEEQAAFQRVASIHHIKKLRAIAEGGDTRQQSVFAGINACPAQTECFAIHDGARALITAELIQRVIDDAGATGASAAAMPAKDTLKIVDESGFVKETPDRNYLWSVQTPQVFEKQLYLKAMNKALADGADYTDDCQLVERLGVPVHLCVASYENIKITTMDDIALAEHILTLREGNV